MKYIFVIVLCSQLFPQLKYKSPAYIENAGGYCLPSTGELKVLFVFAEFPDDNFDINNQRWPKNQAPANMSGWIDSSWSDTPTPGSFTHYFNEMSGNKFKFIGSTRHIVAPHTRKWYRENKKRRPAIHKEILENLDSTIDFNDFDNWQTNGYYNHTPGKDGIIEMVIFVWRSIDADSLSKHFKAHLDFGNNYGDLGRGSDIIVENGTIKIKSSWGIVNSEPGGSGVTVSGYFTQDPFRIALHEFSHYLLGHNDMHNGFGWWGMLADWGTKTYSVNSFERSQLCWFDEDKLITINAKTDSVFNFTTDLDDFITTGEVIKIIIDSTTNKNFYIENHQSLSFWETHSPYSTHPDKTDGLVEPGIYLIRQEGLKAKANGYSNKVIYRQCIPADGRWNWAVEQSVNNPWGNGKLPVFKKLDENVSGGYHDLQHIPFSFENLKSPDVIHFMELEGKPEISIPHKGDGHDAFRVGGNTILSDITNPNNQLSDRSTTNFGFRINSQMGTKINITVFINDLNEIGE